MLPVKFRWFLFSGFRGEVKNVSTKQRPGRPSFSFGQPDNQKFASGRLDLNSRHVWLKCVQWCQRGDRKCVSQLIRGRGDRLTFFRIGPKNTNLIEDIEIMLHWSFVDIRSAVSEDSSKMPNPIGCQDGHLDFPMGPKTQTWSRTFISWLLSRFVEFRSEASEEQSKVSQSIRD